ncbi:MAG: antibiotic biosynthesis monooxygenase [Acidimicrobiia bacterium]|nr:antibiotic biosynthesis monooxygenase [Acidimicrobiia bacterium]
MTRSIVAVARIKEGREAEFEEAALGLAAAVNANEEGCLLYTLSKGSEPLTYVFMERYQDEAAVAAHQGSDHMKTCGRQMGEFMDGPPNVRYMEELG